MRLEPVQLLRALAALSIAYLHTIHESLLLDPGGAGVLSRLPWSAGVDVFFVISGLVMVYSSAGLFAAPGGPRQFVLRRIARLVPLYWALTSLTIAAGLTMPGALSLTSWDPLYLAASYLFLPFERPDGFVQPILRQGWTLNYEMEFYAVFALCLPFPRRVAIPLVLAAIVALVAAGAFLHPASVALRFWTSPVMLEFAIGVVLGALLLRGMRLPAPVRAALLAVAVALAAVPGEVAETPGQHMVLACCAVAGAALGPPTLPRSRATRLAIALGEASYALYLVHAFPMRALQQLWTRLSWTGPLGAATYVAAALATAVLAALALNHALERPATRVSRRLLRA